MSALGLIPRPYEINPPDRGQDVEQWTFGSHMLPDRHGRLEVLARCGRHFVMQDQKAMKRGEVAVCSGRRCRG